MKVTTERIPDSQVVLNIEVEPDTVERYMQLGYRHLAARVNVPGFRRGKASRAMLERYIGRSAIFEEALEHLIPDLYHQAIIENDIFAIAEPHIDLVQTEPLAFKATVAVRPTVVLGDYKSVRVPRQAVVVSDEQVEQVVERLRTSRMEWLTVERPATSGDRMLINVTATTESDGQTETRVDNEDWDYYAVSGSMTPVPGFSEALLGALPGEQRSFTITVPDEEGRGDIRGKDLAFTVLVKEIREGQMPALDDDFAKSMNPECAGLDELRSQLRHDMQQRFDDEIKARTADVILDAVVAGAEIEYPTVLIDREVDHLVREQQQTLADRGIGWEYFLINSQQTEDEYRQGLRPTAEHRLKHDLVMQQVAELEQYAVAPEEIEAEAERLSAGAGERQAELQQAILASDGARSGIEDIVLRRKVIDYLVETCAIDGGVEETAAEVAPEAVETPSAAAD